MAWSSGGTLSRVGDCSWPAPMIVMGLAPSSTKSCKVALVNCSCHWVTHLWVGSYGVHLLDEVCATPLSRWTTKCWSTQRGLAWRQAREPREKNLVSNVIGILSVIDWIFIVIGSFVSCHGGIIFLHTLLCLLYLHSCLVKLFSVVSLWELVSLISVVI